MIRSPRSIHLIMILALLSLGLATGCPSTFSRIDDSALSEQDKAQTKLYSAESSWVQGKEVLADVLTELAFSGVALEPDVKLRIKQVLAGGNQAISSARIALQAGDTSTAGAFASALRDLQAATRALAGATPAIPVAPAPGPPPAPPNPETAEEVTP